MRRRLDTCAIVGVAARSVMAICAVGAMGAAAAGSYQRVAPDAGSMPVPQPLVSSFDIGARIVEDLMHATELELGVIETGSEPNRSAFLAIYQDLKTHIDFQALAKADALDGADPLSAYVKGVVLIRARYDLPAATLLLRRAAQQGIAAADIVLGNLLVKRVDAVEIGTQKPKFLVSFDDMGHAVPTPRDALLAQAAQSYERAAATGRADALRLLGLARARGWSGKRDLVAAAALWRQAGDAGDALAKHELGRLLQSGIGIEADAAEAERLYRATLDSVPASQVALAMLLLPKAMNGDDVAAREAIELLDRYETAPQPIANFDLEHAFIVPLRAVRDDVRMQAYGLHAKLLTVAAPQRLRNLTNGVLMYERAAMLGDAESAFEVGEGLRLAKGVAEDLPCAYGFYLAATTDAPAKVDPILADLAVRIGESGVARGQRIANEIHPWPVEPRESEVWNGKGPVLCAIIGQDPRRWPKTRDEVQSYFGQTARDAGIDPADFIAPH